jgi:hypothetical protein
MLAQLSCGQAKCGRDAAHHCGNSVKDLTFSDGLFPEVTLIL